MAGIRQLSRVAAIGAWVIFVVSFFLPASNAVEVSGTPPGTPLTGWQAFTSSFLVLGAQPLVVLVEPRAIILLAFPIMNLAMLFAPMMVRSSDGFHLPGALFAVAGVMPWLLPKSVTGQLFVGFYLWDFSFFLMAAGCMLRDVE